MLYSHLRRLIGVWSLFYCATALGDADPKESFSRAELDFFEAKVRPVLVQRCFECHSGTSDKPKGHLRLDSRTLAIRGGDSGAAVVPRKPAESLLIAAVQWKSFEMPPQGKLKESEISALVKWIEMGAPWPDGSEVNPLATTPGEYDWQKWRREHWSFQPFARTDLPQVKNETWVQTRMALELL